MDSADVSDKKVLFMPARALAHVSRVLVVAQALRERFAGEIVCAGDSPYAGLFTEAGIAFQKIGNGNAESERKLLRQKHRLLWDHQRYFAEGMAYLKQVVNSEVELFRALKPDLVVCDGQATALLSAELLGVPCIAIANNHLPPPYGRMHFRIPRTFDRFMGSSWFAWASWLPEGVLDRLSGGFGEIACWLIVKLVNKIRREFGLRPFERLEDLLRQPRAVLFADLEDLAPAGHLPENFHYVGPIVWEPAMAVPQPLQSLRNIVYVTMGSSGNPQIFQTLIEAAAHMSEYQVVMATGSLVDPDTLKPLPANVHVYRFLPGAKLAKNAEVVICHGGMGTVYQTLSAGVPLIIIPFHLGHETQAIDRLEELGAGRKMHPRRVTPARIVRVVKEVLGAARYRKSAQAIADQFRLADGPRRAAAMIRRELTGEN